MIFGEGAIFGEFFDSFFAVLMDPSDIQELHRVVLRQWKAGIPISQASNQPKRDPETWSVGVCPTVSSIAEERV